MDAEEIARLVCDLKLSADAKKEAVTITKEETVRGQKRIERVVVGKIFSRRMVNREKLRTNLPKILRSRGRTEIEVVGHNLFVVSFSLVEDKRIAIEEGPWHYFQDLMLLKETDTMQAPNDVEFKDVTMWIQCHNVPLSCMEPLIITRIGSRVGRVEEIDVGEGGLCMGKFARVRVTMDIEKPLVRCVPLMQEHSEREALVILQYEKLPEFCFACGRIGHISRDCKDQNVDKGNCKYDSWLRAGRPLVGTRNKQTEFGKDRLNIGEARGIEGGEGSKGQKTREIGVEGDGVGMDMRRGNGERDYGNGDERRAGMEMQPLPAREEPMDSTGVTEKVTADREKMEEAANRNLGGKMVVLDEEMRFTKRVSPGKTKRKGEGKGWKRRARELKGWKRRRDWVWP